MPDESPLLTIEHLTPADCFRLLRTISTGRVGVSVNALPAVLPVTFTVVEEQVIFKTVLGTTLEAATVGAIIAFEADDYNADRTMGWNVLIQGRADSITKPERIRHVETLGMPSWAVDGTPERYVAIHDPLVSGRRFAR